MKESLFIKLVKYFYGISKPFDELAREVINDAGNKIAIWLMEYLLISAYALMVLISWFSPMNVVSDVIIADIFVYLIASAYMGRIIKKINWIAMNLITKKNERFMVKDLLSADY
ncbi:DUF3278 domain-containing protein [Apilactobacillus kunkeei]|uniref:DUF3278 domain-containing protein n=1 Tax=Apilactobacillus kunkeei TaxID=148814 RepID=UPI002659DAE3|nr:DUF3278 domain-containing protein [Apilactobacillus kunkeei]MCX0325471.1 DUF3278 domain-containing protein [Apilactobacillus kunkeei]